MSNKSPVEWPSVALRRRDAVAMTVRVLLLAAVPAGCGESADQAAAPVGSGNASTPGGALPPAAGDTGFVPTTTTPGTMPNTVAGPGSPEVPSGSPSTSPSPSTATPGLAPSAAVPGAGGGGAVPVDVEEPAASLDCSSPAAPRAPMRRLTRFEYNNTVRDLFGLETAPASALPGEELGNGFANDADALGVSRILIDGYRSVAASIANTVAGDAASASALYSCDPTADEAACREQVVADFGARAFRRPLTSEEAAALSTVFTNGQMLGGDFASGVRALVEASLQMPQFLYRPEVGVTADATLGLGRPTSYEMASRLSYTLWASMPDPELFDAAQQDALTTAEQIRAQAVRMVANDKARDVVRYFHTQLLGLAGLDTLTRSAEYYPTFTANMGLLFREETERFVDHVVWEDAGDFRSLLTAPYSFMNRTLAEFYGVPGVTEDTFERVDLDPTQRAGFVTQGSVMALTTPGSRTNPIVRSKWLLQKLLCVDIPDPPVGLMVEEPEITPGVSTRERFIQHREDPSCAACHDILDPVGFAFENFDGVGLWRDMDNGVPISSAGEIAVSDIAGPFTGPIDLLTRVADSGDAHACYVGSWLAYGYGLTESAAEACTRQSLETAFAASGGNVQDLLVALTQTDTFLYRPLPGAP